MARYHNVALLQDASGVVLTAFCAAVAERMLDVYAEIVDEDELGWAKDSLAEVWNVVAGEADSDVCAVALEEIEAEASVEENCDLGSSFYAARIIDLLGLALESALRPDFRKAEFVANTAETLLSSLDFALSGERAVIYRQGEQLPPPGPLVSRDIVADAEFFEVLRRAGLSVDAPAVSAAVVSELRRVSRAVGEEYGRTALDVISVDG
ncbi:hypothetical protein [Streptomyces sp. NRRL F-525]|uniref:hypothetical protein n=1 Tax=Streptomyces sp. NRRL F-525 TaxID=1463861 RepID=UPI00131AB4D3|nr:hypothetical protein [Streptomyces sp. NRRL F-525]